MPKDRPPSPRLTEKEGYYRELFEEAEGRGVSRAQLAVEKDVSVGTLSWWKSEIRRTDALRRGQRVKARNRRSEETIEFVPVDVSHELDESAPAPVAAGWTFEVALPDGVAVRVPDAFEEASLVRVLRAVRAAC